MSPARPLNLKSLHINHGWHDESHSQWKRAKFAFPDNFFECVSWLPNHKLAFWNAVSKIWVSWCGDKEALCVSHRKLYSTSLFPPLDNDWFSCDALPRWMLFPAAKKQRFSRLYVETSGLRARCADWCANNWFHVHTMITTLWIVVIPSLSDKIIQDRRGSSFVAKCLMDFFHLLWSLFTG